MVATIRNSHRISELETLIPKGKETIKRAVHKYRNSRDMTKMTTIALTSCVSVQRSMAPFQSKRAGSLKHGPSPATIRVVHNLNYAISPRFSGSFQLRMQFLAYKTAHSLERQERQEIGWYGPNGTRTRI
jgi:hypothetical protein